VCTDGVVDFVGDADGGSSRRGVGGNDVCVGGADDGGASEDVKLSDASAGWEGR